jgi:hypothetical protein
MLVLYLRRGQSEGSEAQVSSIGGALWTSVELTPITPPVGELKSARVAFYRWTVPHSPIEIMLTAEQNRRQLHCSCFSSESSGLSPPSSCNSLCLDFSLRCRVPGYCCCSSAPRLDPSKPLSLCFETLSQSGGSERAGLKLRGGQAGMYVGWNLVGS